MTSKGSGLLDRAKLRLATSLLPMRTTDISLLDGLEIALGVPGIVSAESPRFAFPTIAGDFCPQRPLIGSTPAALDAPQTEDCSDALRLADLSRGLPIDLTAGMVLEPRPIQVQDLTEWLVQVCEFPVIEVVGISLAPPRKAGKAYGRPGDGPQQMTLFGDAEGDIECVHGIRKRFCSECIQRERVRQTQVRAVPTINPFDVIFPVLHPPLGDNLDSPVAFPQGKELYPFQREGVRFLAENEVALLSDEMGLGKSIQAIVALRLLSRQRGTLSGLILSPKSVLTDWEKKLWEWAPELRVVKVRGSPEERQVLWSTPAHVYLTTYETLSRDMSTSSEITTAPGLRLSDTATRGFDFIVLDEVQKIKNPDSNVTRVTRKVNARIRWGLSGTPLENRVEEIISIFAYLKPGLLRYEYVGRPDKVKEMIKPYVLRRRKMDVLASDLPPKLPESVWLELTPEQRETYDRLESEGAAGLSRMGSAVTVQHVLALITKLKQVCNLDPETQESCKLEYLVERLDEISAQGDKALVFSQYPEKTLRSLEPKLARFSPLIFEGSLSDARRDRIVDTFQNSEQNRVLLMSVKAGGIGLTLTRANYVFHYDLWWNPAIAAQAEDRAHRIGQKKTVFVTYLYTVGTIEERIDRLLQRKRALFHEIIDDLSDANLSTALTEEELFSLFDLKSPKQPTLAGSQLSRRRIDSSSLNGLSPSDFEQLVATLYEKMGYSTRVTQKSSDGGVDVWAVRSADSGTEHIAIQCKHYPGRQVGVEHARALYGVITSHQNVTRGVLITSGEFSGACQDYARGKRIELVDMVRLTGLLEKYPVLL